MALINTAADRLRALKKEAITWARAAGHTDDKNAALDLLEHKLRSSILSDYQRTELFRQAQHWAPSGIVELMGRIPQGEQST